MICVAVAEGIGCFVCHSLDGSDPGCEDPFRSADSYYWEECLATKDSNRSDSAELHFASHCIKVSGTYSKWVTYTGLGRCSWTVFG